MKRATDVSIPPLALDRRRPLAPQVSEALRAAMQCGRLQPDDRLPATRSLARALGISRQVVVAAYEDLAAGGYVRGRIGDGSYVACRASAGWPPPARRLLDPDAHLLLVWPLR